MSAVRRLLRGAAPALAAGLAGTATMASTAAAYARLRGTPEAVPGAPPVVRDFDNSDHVVVAAATLLRLHPRTPAARRALFWTVHWGYGSAFGLGYALLRRVVSRPAATAVFYGMGQAMAAVLFPLAGGTPPPWRWTREQQATSVVQHVIYAAAVAAAYERRSRAPRPPD